MKMIEDAEKVNDSKVEDKEENKRSVMKQMISAFAINSVAFLQGASVSSSSIILPNLNENDQTNTMTLQTNDTTSIVTTADDDILNHLFYSFTVSEETGSWIGE